MEKLFVKLRSWYMDKDDEASRIAVALTFQVSRLSNALNMDNKRTNR